jgi:hypothetical protein
MEKLILIILAVALLMVPMSAMANHMYFKVPSTWATGTSNCNYAGLKPMSFTCNSSAANNGGAVADRYWKFQHPVEVQNNVTPSYHNMAVPY